MRSPSLPVKVMSEFCVAIGGYFDTVNLTKSIGTGILVEMEIMHSGEAVMWKNGVVSSNNRISLYIRGPKFN
jgi:hypothetical protein